MMSTIEGVERAPLMRIGTILRQMATNRIGAIRIIGSDPFRKRPQSSASLVDMMQKIQRLGQEKMPSIKGLRSRRTTQSY